MKNFIIGLIAGIGNITPGVSGSALLIIMGVYQKCINSISNIFKNPKQSIKYLFPIGIGILIGTVLFSNIIEYFITKYEVITKIVFVFFIIGTIPSLVNNTDKSKLNYKHIIAFVITLLIGISLIYVNLDSNAYIINDLNIKNIILLVSIGFLVAFATVIPGISCTVLLTMLGLYLPYLKAIAKLQIPFLLPIVFGAAIGTFVLSKIINYLFEKYYNFAYCSIIGFVIATIPALIPNKITSTKDLILGIILGTIALTITIIIDKKAKKKQ